MTSLVIALWLTMPWYHRVPVQHSGVFVSMDAAQEYLERKRIVTFTIYEVQADAYKNELKLQKHTP